MCKAYSLACNSRDDDDERNRLKISSFSYTHTLNQKRIEFYQFDCMFQNTLIERTDSPNDLGLKWVWQCTILDSNDDYLIFSSFVFRTLFSFMNSSSIERTINTNVLIIFWLEECHPLPLINKERTTNYQMMMMKNFRT